ncbi:MULTISPECIES: TonB-dependent receptor [Rhodomicrobium]|uniref:TonB-dependent receptor family protein n=1 Tax=Rhodomicrobium TaxID=1068 RepID=UPI001FD9CFB2|nr:MULTISPECIES: TonB-dependent receptor [Rhodomicrobium]
MTTTQPFGGRPMASALRTRMASAALGLLALTAAETGARAQQSQPIALPGITVESQQAQPEAQKDSAAATGFPGGEPRSRSLTVPTLEEARRELSLVPGAVSVVSGADYREATSAKTIKDALDYVPGVFVQPKWGDDSRLSIRGSSLSRNFHLRGINLYMDGIPINTADGFGDFQELDPTAYDYIEVYKGANALRFGAATLGGAINFVTATGRNSDPFAASVDMGSFGFKRIQSSAGGEAGAFDFFVTGSAQEQDGYRDHSGGESQRLSSNLGIRLSPDAETRFYLNANHVEQDIPGAVTKDAALNSPTTAASGNVTNDQERNIDTLRFANKTTALVAPGTVVEVGAFGVDRHLKHPIFQWLDYKYLDYGAFGRVMNESNIGGFKNRLLIGLNQHNGSTDADQYENKLGEKGRLLSSAQQDSTNTTAYIENAFYVLPDVALVTGTQFLYASRELEDKFLSNGDQSGQNDFSAWSPKVGVLWEVDPHWQVFANVSRSAEAPSFGENSDDAGAAFKAELQTATTYEIGTRGRRPDYSWDVALYRANLDHELYCVTAAGAPAGSCAIRNADETIHQGVELGFGASVLRSLLEEGERPDRLWLNMAYTYNDFRFDDDAQYGDNELPGAPRHFLRAELLYKHPNGFFAGPNVECVPEAYFVDNANSVTTESYVLYGMKAGFDDGGAFSLYVEGRNLADTHYIASTSIADQANASSALFEPGTGRAFYAGAKVRW